MFVCMLSKGNLCIFLHCSIFVEDISSGTAGLIPRPSSHINAGIVQLNQKIQSRGTELMFGRGLKKLYWSRDVERNEASALEPHWGLLWL